MKWYKSVVFISLFLIPNMVHAECSNSEIVQYQEQAKNINITYDYTEYAENNFASFSIKIANLTPGIYLRDDSTRTFYHYTGEDINLDNYDYGNTYKFTVYSDGGNCPGRYIATKYVNLPYYNARYKSPLCEGIEEFKYCQKWARVQNVSDYEFEKAIEKYKKTLEQENNENNKNLSSYDVLKFLLKIYINSYYFVLPIIIIGGIIIIRRHNKKQELF